MNMWRYPLPEGMRKGMEVEREMVGIAIPSFFALGCW